MKFVFFLLKVSFLFSLNPESSEPYISGYTWWHFCDWRLTHPDFGKTTNSSFNPHDVQLGDTLFVEYNALEEFAKDYLPKLEHKVILITGNYGYNGDMPLPGPHASILESDKIGAWFVQNIDRPPTEKLIPMPIGLASNYWPHGDERLVDQIIPQALANRERPTLVYLNFTLCPQRFACANHFNLMGIKQEARKSYADYLKDLSHSVFVASPPGGGVDCHRTWEALLLGCYPIVESSFLNPLYTDLPVVVVESWDEVTDQFLEAKYLELKTRDWPREKLYFPYWKEKVKEIQNQIREID